VSEQLVILLGAVILDLLVGDPQGWPHPVRAIGRLVVYAERASRALICSARWAGVVTVVGVVIICGSVTILVLLLAAAVHPVVESIASALIIYTCLGARDLSDHAWRVVRSLGQGTLEDARRHVGMMVSRETGELDAGGVSRAAIESVAENLVDGVMAPLFFAVLFGPVGAVVFKAVSTMDSMIGKRNERYRAFGTFAARCDDVLNFVPARVGLLLIALAAPLVRLNARGALRIGWRDRRNHASPNSAWSEAAFAGALGVQLGGSDVYAGKTVAHPTLGEGDPPAPAHLARAMRLMWASYLVAIAVVAAIVILCCLRCAVSR